MASAGLRMACILMLGKLSESGNPSLIYSSVTYDEGSFLHFLDFSSDCVSCALDNSTSRPAERKQGWTDLDGGSLDFLYSDHAIFIHNSKGRSIERIILGTSNRTTVFDMTSEKVRGIAVDWLTRNLYYIDERISAIVVTSLDNKMAKVLVHTGIEKPAGLALDPVRGFLCWSSHSGKHHLQCIQLSDMTRTDILHPDRKPEEPSGVAFNYTSGQVFWVDKGRASVNRANTDGTGHETLYSLQGTRFVGVTMCKGVVAVLDEREMEVRLVDVTVNPRKTIVLPTELNGNPKDIIFYDERRQPKAKHACETFTCDGFCVNNGPSSPPTCLCPEGKTEYGGQCITATSVTPPKFVFSVGSAVCSEDLLNAEKYGTRSAAHECIWSKLADVTSLAVSAHAHLMYYYIKGSKVIYESPMTTSGKAREVFKNIGQVGAMVFDDATNLLLWTDEEKGAIFVGSPEMGHSEAFTAETPRGITLMYRNSDCFLFWTKTSGNPGLYRARPDGRQNELIKYGTEYTGYLASDERAERIYLASPDTGEIISVTFDGTEEKLLLKRQNDAIFGIAVYEGYVAWTETKTGGGMKPEAAIMYVTKDFDFSLPTGSHGYYGDGTHGYGLAVFVNKTKDAQTQSACTRRIFKKCDHICLPTSSRNRICLCVEGFVLDADGYTCKSEFSGDSSCPALPPVNHGTRHCSNSWKAGSTCWVSCADGYQPVPANHSQVCQPNRLWSRASPTCEPRTCPPLLTTVGAGQQCDFPAVTGAKCTSTCVEGSVPIGGDNERTCLSTFMWSGSPLQCTATTCSPLATPAGASLKCDTPAKSGAKCETTCTEGRVAIGGNSERICQPTLTWSGSDLQCIESAENKSNAGLIAGSVIAVLAVIIIVVALIFFLRRWRKPVADDNYLDAENEARGTPRPCEAEGDYDTLEMERGVDPYAALREPPRYIPFVSNQ